jgi:heme A synthase
VHDPKQIIRQKVLWLAFISLGLVYTAMLLGVYITASHQGLSCPNWPLCPNNFNFPPDKYLFEHFHRMTAFVAACVVLIMFVYAIRRAKYVGRTIIATGIAVLIQILLGMLVVNTKLQALLVAAHLLNGVVLFTLALITFVSAYRSSKVSPGTL